MKIHPIISKPQIGVVYYHTDDGHKEHQLYQITEIGKHRIKWNKVNKGSSNSWGWGQIRMFRFMKKLRSGKIKFDYENSAQHS